MREIITSGDTHDIKETALAGFQTQGGQHVGHPSLVHRTMFDGSPPTQMTSEAFLVSSDFFIFPVQLSLVGTPRWRRG